MLLTNLFKLKKSCTHDKIRPDIESGYCPDCGEFIQNEWYITRCACCGIKLRTVVHNGDIKPQDKFCLNCGGEEYTVEKLNKINFIDINYAALKKTIIPKASLTKSTIQCWQEKTFEPPKLTVKYL